jgi:outer membrane protein insertion porin family
MKMHTAMIILLASFATAQAARCAEAPVVREVRFENRGPGRIDAAYVRAHVADLKGQPVDRGRISRDVRTLLDTGLFTDVRVELVQTAEGVDLVYGLVAKWRLAAPVEIVGAERYRQGRMRDWIGLEPGDVVDDQVLGAKTRKLIQEYRKDYFANAEASWTIEPVDRAEGLAKVTVRIVEEDRIKVKRIVFLGNRSVKRADLLEAVSFRSWYNPMRYFKGQDHEAADLALIRTAVRNAYLNRGRLDVDVQDPVVERDERGVPFVAVRLTEGGVYRIGGIAVSGIAIFPEDLVMKEIRLRRGDVAALSAIEAAAQALRDFYGHRGYIETAVRHTLKTDPERLIADVHFTVREGSLTRLRDIRIVGNTRTLDKVIRRELPVTPGEIYDEVRVKRGERRLNNLGYFSRVEAYPTPTGVDGVRDLAIEVEEKPTGQFMIGAGFSSIDQVMGFIELSQGNFDLFGWPYFTGGGQKMKFRSQFGSTRTEYDISFTEPWFLDRRLAFSLDLYQSEVEYSDYDVERMGVSPALSTALPWNNRIELRYRLEWDKVTDLADTNEYIVVDTGEPYYFDWEEDATKSSVTLTLSHDTRDNAFVPTRGTLASLFYTVTGGPFGFDTDLYRVGARGRQFYSPWFKHVISAQVRYEVVDGYGDTEEVGITDRLFIGGGRTIRGFDYRDVGPKAVPADDPDGDSYRPLGGQSLAFASAEYSIPLVKAIRLAAFYDIGNVWTAAYDLDLKDLASGAGVGLRFDLPGFPIRIDRAWVIERDDDLTDEDKWVFWIGYDY